MSESSEAVVMKFTRTLQVKKRKNTQLYSKNIIPLLPPATLTGATAQLLTRFQWSPSSWPWFWPLCSNRLKSLDKGLLPYHKVRVYPIRVWVVLQNPSIFIWGFSNLSMFGHIQWRLNICHFSCLNLDNSPLLRRFGTQQFKIPAQSLPII